MSSALSAGRAGPDWFGRSEPREDSRTVVRTNKGSAVLIVITSTITSIPPVIGAPVIIGAGFAVSSFTV